MIYEDSRESLGLDQEAICTVRDLLEKAVTDYAILPAKPNMGEVKKVLAILEKHSVIQRIVGKYSELSCRFVILPTVLVVVSAEKMNSTVTMLQKEEKTNETAQTALAD